MSASYDSDPEKCAGRFRAGQISERLQAAQLDLDRAFELWSKNRMDVGAAKLYRREAANVLRLVREVEAQLKRRWT